MHFKSSLRYFRMPCVLRRPPFTKLFDSKFVGIPLFRLSFHRLSWHFRCSHVRKTSSFFFFFYSTTVKDFISRVNRVTIYPKQFSVSTSAADLHSGNGLHDNEISAYSEKEFIKDIKVNNSIHFFSLSRFSITNSLVSVSLIYTNIIWILFSFLFFIK